MALIDWSDEYIVEIEILDEQHRNLVAIINKFEDARRRGKGARIMTQILNEIAGYTQEHFACEERMMEEAGYAHLKKHQSQHRQLLQRIERLQFDFQQGNRRITVEVGELFQYWVTSHILKHDKEYSASLQAVAAGV